MKFDHGGEYLGMITMRETHRGMPIKPGVKEVLDGKTMVFTYCWVCEDDEKYPGECAMDPSVMKGYDSPDNLLFREAGITWIASGDVKWAEK